MMSLEFERVMLRGVNQRGGTAASEMCCGRPALREFPKGRWGQRCSARPATAAPARAAAALPARLPSGGANMVKGWFCPQCS